jgi:hypothetical protein
MAIQNRYAQRQRSAPAAASPPQRRRLSAPSGRRTPGRPTTDKKPYIVVGVTFGALILGTTLFNHITRTDPEAPTASCVIAVDAQGSAAGMKDAYRQWIPSQAEVCAQQGDLSITLVSGKTRTSTVTPVTGSLSSLEYTGNDANDAVIAKNEIDRVVQEADEAILAAPRQRGGTDILGVICVAHDLLRGHSPSTLIINSDGINNRKPYQLAKAPLDDASIATYVDQLKADGQLCDLTGTQVHMYGVGIGSGTGKMSDEQLAGVRRFWEAAIRATGGDLVTYQRNP